MAVDVDRDLVVELTRDLIKFPSVNPPGDELPAAQYLARRMTELGIEAEIQELEPNRGNVIGRIRGRGAGHLVFTGHLDVVPPGEQAWQHPPFDADLVDGRIYGRGSADMKGAVASFVTAAAALSRSGFQPAADIVLAITCGEEAGMLGAAAMVDRRSLEGSRYLVVGEATQLDVVIGEKGVLWVHVRAIGRTAHGSMPDLGVNAVSTIARLIPRLEEYPFPFEESALLGKPTLSVNIIGGGNKTNVVPDSCEIAIDMRTVPGQDHEAIIRQLREMADEVARDYHSEARIEIEIENDKQALETAPDDSLVGATIESVRSILGRDPAVRGVTYGTDAAHLGPGFNIPMVICGPGEPGQLHQPDENIEVDQLVQAAQIYTDLAQRLVG